MFDETNKGRRVELISTNDMHTKLKPGALGTYEYCNKNGNLHQHSIKWDEGSHLMLVTGVQGSDQFKFIDEEEKEFKESVNIKELSKEDFIHAFAFCYEGLFNAVSQAMKDKRIPHSFLNHMSLLAHRTALQNFKTRFGEIKTIPFHF